MYVCMYVCMYACMYYVTSDRVWFSYLWVQMHGTIWLYLCLNISAMWPLFSSVGPRWWRRNGVRPSVHTREYCKNTAGTKANPVQNRPARWFDDGATCLASTAERIGKRGQKHFMPKISGVLRRKGERNWIYSGHHRKKSSIGICKIILFRKVWFLYGPFNWAQ